MPPKPNPYKKFKLLPLDLQGWNSQSPVFRALIELTKPTTIIEVGAWKGASTINMALIAQSLGLPLTIYTVDTWVPTKAYPDVPEDLYDQFLSNVSFSQLQKVIIPLKMTSDEAFEYFVKQKISAELIYLDGNHEYDFVKTDIANYSKLVKPMGVLFGDDYIGWPGVIQAVDEFKAANPNLPFENHQEKWAFRILGAPITHA